MKAIILEIRDGYAAALREDGVVVKIRQAGRVGETVELKSAGPEGKVVPFPKRSKRLLRTAVAAMLALAVTGGTYTYTNVAEASYVTLDTEETSVELAVNRVGRIVRVRALDDDSDPFARELTPDVRHKRVEDAVDVAMTHMGGAPTVVAGVTGETDRGTDSLRRAVERGAGRREHDGMEFHAFAVSRDERHEAFRHDMSGGRWAFEHGGGVWNAPPPPPPEGRPSQDDPPPPPPDAPRQALPDGQTAERPAAETEYA